MGLPKSIIKKYGVSKKAWQVYRGEKTHSRRTTSMAKKHSRKSRSGGFGMKNITGGAMDVLKASGGAYIYKAYGEKMLPIQDGKMRALVGVGIGLFLASQKNDLMRSAGKGVAYVEGTNFIAQMLNNASGSQSNDNSANGW